MTKDFAIPPVVFPAGTNVQQRRFPAAPFQPPRPSSSAIPFMSFDIGSAAASSATPAGPFSGTMNSSSSFGGGSASFEDEEPLLDELGIHPDQIWKKTRSILNPFRINQTVHQDSDLSGPIFLYLALCLFQLLAGKIQFGVILGWIVVSSIFLYAVFNMLAGRNGNLNLHTCTSLVGYCLLPVVILSAVSLFVPQGAGPVRFALAAAFVLWSTRACSALVVSLADGGEEHRGLISSEGLVIWNPTMRRFLTLAKPESCWRDPTGFIGHDPIDGTYKALCMPTYGLHLIKERKNSNQPRILTLGRAQESWRFIQGSFEHFLYHYRGRCINGVLYYEAFLTSHFAGRCLMSFHVKSEKFLMIQVPWRRDLLTYEGKLAALGSFDSDDAIEL